MPTWPLVMQRHVSDQRKPQIKSHSLLHLVSARRPTPRHRLLQMTRLSTRRWTMRLQWTRRFTWYHAAGSAVAGAMFRLIQAIQDSSKTLTVWTASAWAQTSTNIDVTGHKCVAALPLSTRQATSQPSAKASQPIRPLTVKTLSLRGK